MKALSIKQPFAELIISGKKSIELRNWNTKFRGEFLIHASKVPDKKTMEKFKLKELPLGQIIGKVTIKEVKQYTKEDFKKDKNKHLGSNYHKYGFILTNPKRIKEINVKGKLNFWEYNPLDRAK